MSRKSIYFKISLKIDLKSLAIFLPRLCANEQKKGVKMNEEIIFGDKSGEEHIYDNKCYRNFILLIYDESIHYDFNEVLFNIKSFKYYAIIKHQPESDEKVAHYHVIIRVDSATTERAIAKRVGIPIDKVRYIKNVRSACRYLTHIDFPDKIQYNLSDLTISGLFQRKFLKNFEDVKTEEEIIQDIYNFIDNFHEDSYFMKVRMLVQFINLNCYDTIYKRYRPEFLDYLKSNL